MSTFGPGDSFDGSSWVIAGPPAVGLYQAWAESFSSPLARATRLASFRVAEVADVTTSPLHVDVLRGPDMNVATLLESFTTTSGGIITFTSVLRPLILPGQTYWIALSVDPTTSAWYGWNVNNQGFVGGSENRFPNETDPWKTVNGPRGTFDVTVTPVPEPATFVLIAPALLAICLTVGRRRVKGQQH